LSNFGRAARQSTSVLISLGLPHAPSFLRGHLLNSFVRNSESRRERLFSRDTNKNANTLDGCSEPFSVFSTCSKNFPENMESNK
jgi:hypothetical protein